MDALTRHRLGRLTRALVYAVVVAIPIAVLAFLIRAKFDPLVRADDRVIVAATDVTRAHDGFHSLLTVWEAVSQPWVVYLVIGLPVALVAWFRLDLKTRAWWALATMIGGWLVAVGVKQVVGRARPVVDDPVSHPNGFSFPSGHATNNTIMWGAVLVLLWPVLAVAVRRAVAGVAVAWVLVTGADRVFLGAHFLSDVIAGVLMGCGLVAASYAGYQGWTPTDDSPEGTT
jgi:undecaprenyl-diphosphatase